MEKLATYLFVFMTLVWLSCPATSDEEFNYDPTSKKGPAHWGDIRPEWFKCKNGTMQSPIDISKAEVKVAFHSSENLQINYQPSNATLRNTGHDIQLQWPGGAGYILINGTQYVLQQCHWHSPSEHIINGSRRLELELHLVHQSQAGQIAVIGILYKAGAPNPFLQTLSKDLKFISKNKEAVRALGVVDPKQIVKIKSKQYYRYMGSLTTPPCDENVVWTIFREAETVSMEQVRLLRVAVRDESYTNARPLQPINNRPVYLYASKHPEQH